MQTNQSLAIQSHLDFLGEVAPYTIVFIKPKSANWPIVQEFCLHYGNYQEAKDFSFARFGDSPEQLKVLSSVLRLVDGWKSVMMFVKNEFTETWKIHNWLRCYVESQNASNSKAYCISCISTGTIEQDLLYIYNPCRILSVPTLSTLHTASLQDQIQASAVTNGIFRCPNFDIDNFKVIKKVDKEEQGKFFIQL